MLLAGTICSAQESPGVPLLEGSRVFLGSSGGSHSCVLNGSGALLCWGANDSGQLGDGGMSDRGEPTVVEGLGSGVVAATLGDRHSCAIDTGDALWCWGDNFYGQLGNASQIDASTPTAVSGLGSGVAAVAGGYDHTCALTDAGAMLCWGDNFGGRLGDGTTTDRSIPQQVSGLTSGIESIAAGFEQSCAVTTMGAALCWGNNDFGEVGDNSTSRRTTPVAVSGLSSGVAKITAGFYHTCALTDGGGVLCWGFNCCGQLGNGTNNDSPIPVAVNGLSSGVADIAAGFFHTCALTDGGSVQCWGLGVDGQLGDGLASDSNVPVQVSGLASGASAISAGLVHSCAVLDDTTLRCWGTNDRKQLGDGSQTDATTPVTVLVKDAPRQVATLTPDGNEGSIDAQSDASGRYVVFQSRASNLTGGPDSNNADDIFRLDLATGETVRVSVDDDESETTGDAFEPSVSADGALIVFVAADTAVSKVHGETPTARSKRQKAAGFSVFLRNMLTGQTQRMGPGTTTGTGTQPQIAPDGDAVVFTAPVDNAELGTPGQNNIFRVPLMRNGAERIVGTSRCVSCKAISTVGVETGDAANGESRNAVLSADGNEVVYETGSTNQSTAEPSPCPAGNAQVMLRNMLTGVVRRISPPSNLSPTLCGSTGSTAPSVDYSGNTIAFASDQGLKPGVAPGIPGVYLGDVRTGSRVRVSETPAGLTPNAAAAEPVISGDGRTIAFTSAATDLDDSFVDTNGRIDVHVKRFGRPVERVSRSTLGAQANEDSRRPALNYNASRLLFDSRASNLSGTDTNNLSDVFQRVVPSTLGDLFTSGFE